MRNVAKRALKRALALALAVALALAAAPAAFAAPPPAEPREQAQSPFASYLESKYVDPDRVYSTDVRWWLGTASNTTDSLREEIQALYDGGFRGVELCMQNALGGAPNEVYAYGSDQWSYKWKLMMNELLDMGMGVYLTSGTHWATSNVPGLDPDSQAAMQNVTMATSTVAAGETLTALPKPVLQRDAATFIGAYALKQSSETGTGNSLAYVVDYGTEIDIAAQAEIAQGETPFDQTLSWTAPEGEGDTWRVFAYWTQGTYHASNPSTLPSYSTNYFDVRGVEALREFWEDHYLDDPALNEKIKNGDVQLFMDSLEINQGRMNDGAITFWAQDFAQEFQSRYGYDIRPYLFLTHGLINGFNLVATPYYETKGTHDLTDNKMLREKIINDYQGFLTDLYMERMLTPLKEWLNSVGIETRAQITYGRPLEISEPIMAVDYPEAESFNQYHQVDIYRLWSGGAKLENKVLSQEGGTQIGLHGATSQMHFRDAYSHYAAGFARAIWHIWGSVYSYNAAQPWAGDTAGGTGFYRFSWREPNYRDYDEFNAHLGRVQQLLQTGRSRTDVGFVHNSWFQGVRFGGGIGDNITQMNWQFAHQGIYYRSTELQDNGYTYDYFSPAFLFDDDVYFDAEKKTVEQAGYKALVLYQRWLDFEAAKKILELAKQGLPVVVVDGAAVATTNNDGNDAALADVMAELLAQPTVRVAKVNDPIDYFLPVAGAYDDEVYEKLQELGVRPYAEFAGPNHQLLTQSRVDEQGNMYLYAYNYCPNDYHQYSHREEIRGEDHGTNIKTEIKMDGRFVPYEIDAFSGQATELGEYRYENGQTVFAIDLDFGNIALYAFEATDEDRLHVVDTDAASAYSVPGGVFVRATESGEYRASLSDGTNALFEVDVPAARDISDWDVTVHSWDASETVGDIVREETLLGVTTKNYRTSTVVTDIDLKLDALDTWDNIPEIGRDVSGTVDYAAKFDWDAGAADGAYIDFGDTLAETMEVWVNGIKVGGGPSQNPTKAAKAVSGTVDGQPVVGRVINSGGVNWTKPLVDVGPYLVDGENTIAIDYSSSLTNRQLARGYIREAMNSRSWWGNHITYRSYGPAQAVLVPYVDSSAMEIGVSTADKTAFGDKAEYVISAKGMDAVNLINVTFVVDAGIVTGEGAVLEGLGGFRLFEEIEWTDLGGGKLQGKAIIGSYTGATASGDADVAKLSLSTLKLGDSKLEITGAEAYGIDMVDGAAESNRRIAVVEPGSAVTKVWSVYDVNGDNKVNNADLSLAFYYYLSKDGDSNWVEAARADVDGSGDVNITDLLAIYANYMA